MNGMKRYFTADEWQRYAGDLQANVATVTTPKFRDFYVLERIINGEVYVARFAGFEWL